MRSTPLFMASLAGFGAAQNLTAALAGNNQTSSLAGVVAMYPELVTALSNATNITVLAPSNDAISALTSSPAGATFASDQAFAQAVLSYHILQGTYRAQSILDADSPLFEKTLLQAGQYANVTGGQNLEVVGSDSNVTFISGLAAVSNVIQADVNFTGGVIHVIDSVLTLPANISTTVVAANLTALAGALTSAQLVSTVEGLSDITVFAPNNAAFQAIGSALPNLTTEQLTMILTYHVVNAGVIFSTDLQNGTQVATVNGANLTITVSDGDYFVNGAQIIQPNILVQNGVVHVIDNVLNPSNSTATPTPSATSGMPAFSGASSTSNIALTSGVATPTSALGAGTTAAAGTGSGSGSASGSSASATSTGAAGRMKGGSVFSFGAVVAAGAAFVV